MDGWTLCLVLLLPLIVCGDSEATVTLVKTLGREPDVTKLCNNATMNIITVVVCRISTERSGGRECSLLYQYGEDFEHGCGSKFRLMTENQMMFLHLFSLSAEDSGNYTCECSYPGATNTVHLNITVEESEEEGPTQMTVPRVFIGASLILVMSGLILGFFHRRLSNGRRLDTQSSRPHRETKDIEPYSTFVQRENGLYSTVVM